MGVWRSWILVLSIGAALAACRNGPKAPGGEGLCWLRAADGTFSQIASDIANVETCAARLEEVWLKDRKPITGAYGGHLLALDEAGIWFDLNGSRVRLLVGNQRDSIDRLISDGEKPVVGQP